MVKKFKSLPESQLTHTVKESAQQIWLAGLGAFSKAQAEGSKVFDALVKEGQSIQKKTRKLADDQIADVRKVADAKVAAMTGKAAGTWDRLEQVFEDRVARALASLGVPTKKEVDKLAKRVAELSTAVQELGGTGQGSARKVTRPATRVAAKPVAKTAAVKVASKPAATKAVARKATPAKKPAATKSVAVKAVEPVNAAPGATTVA
jgi:poly(hydroxyalkanoate) granule-associated protein